MIHDGDGNEVGDIALSAKQKPCWRPARRSW